MQVVPMGTMDRPAASSKATNAQVVKMVQLEGKTRLPQRIQEAVLDIGALMISAQQTGPNGETTTLHQAIRSTAGTESVLNNTAYSLKRLETAVEKASHRNALIERSVPQLSDALAKLQDISHVCRRINEDIQPRLPNVKK